MPVVWPLASRFEKQTTGEAMLPPPPPLPLPPPPDPTEARTGRDWLPNAIPNASKTDGRIACFWILDFILYCPYGLRLFGFVFRKADELHHICPGIHGTVMLPPELLMIVMVAGMYSVTKTVPP